MTDPKRVTGYSVLAKLPEPVIGFVGTAGKYLLVQCFSGSIYWVNAVSGDVLPLPN